MLIESPSFDNKQQIPADFSCDGKNINPELIFSDVPDDTKSLALIVDDPDAPNGDWVHWTLWNISPKTNRIFENSVPEEAVEGITSFGKPGYGGPCPPSGLHHYIFHLYALDSTLHLSPNTLPDQLRDEVRAHIIDSAELVGLYTRT